MKKLMFLGLIALLATSGLVIAAKPADAPKGRGVVSIPEHAREVAPGVFSLGTAIDNGRVVEGYAFVRYKKGFVKPGTECGNGICEPGENARKCPADCDGGVEDPDASDCYDFLARGAKWKTIEPYMVDPENTRGLDGTFVRNNLAYNIDKWETEAVVNILGDEDTTGVVDGADFDSPDNKNEVQFADIDHEGAIAIAVTWGIFGGPPPFRELVEWDQIYDDVDFDWSENCETEDCTGKMDFENIATHELGHSVGLSDLYTTECSEQTMYGYASDGETKKRTLEAGDITGVQKLYGA